MPKPENLWGEIRTEPEIRPPVVILREQASLLGELTNKLLLGDVGVNRKSGDLRITLRIVAPAIENYTYDVLIVIHGVLMYPAAVYDLSSDNQRFECPNEDAFLSAVKQILSSQKVQGVIASLLAQSKLG